MVSTLSVLLVLSAFLINLSLYKRRAIDVIILRTLQLAARLSSSHFYWQITKQLKVVLNLLAWNIIVKHSHDFGTTVRGKFNHHHTQ